MPNPPDERPLIVQLRERREEKREALKVAAEARDASRVERDKVREGRATIRTEFEARSAGDSKPSDEQVAEHRAAEDKFAADERDFAAGEDAWKFEFDARSAEIREFGQRIKDQKVMAKRRKEAADESGKAPARVQDALTYRADNAREFSYFVDLGLSADQRQTSHRTTPEAARERLQRHAAEIETEMPKRAEARARAAAKQVEKAERDFRSSVGVKSHLETDPFQRRDVMGASPTEYRVNPNRTDGQGGFYQVAAA